MPLFFPGLACHHQPPACIAAIVFKIHRPFNGYVNRFFWNHSISMVIPETLVFFGELKMELHRCVEKFVFILELRTKPVLQAANFQLVAQNRFVLAYGIKFQHSSRHFFQGKFSLIFPIPFLLFYRKLPLILLFPILLFLQISSPSHFYSLNPQRWPSITSNQMRHFWPKFPFYILKLVLSPPFTKPPACKE